MKLNIGGKEINIKFGYKPTLKERIISKTVKFSKFSDKDGNVEMEKVEDLLMYLPEMLLVGMQVHHKEYRYDYETGEGKEKQLDKAFVLIEEYLEAEGNDALTLFNSLAESLQEDSFLAGMFRKEQAKAQTAQTPADNIVPMENTEN